MTPDALPIDSACRTRVSVITAGPAARAVGTEPGMPAGAARAQASSSTARIRPSRKSVVGDGEPGQPVLMHLPVDGDPPLITFADLEVQRRDRRDERDGDRCARRMHRMASGLDGVLFGLGDLIAVAVDQLRPDRELL